MEEPLIYIYIYIYIYIFFIFRGTPYLLNVYRLEAVGSGRKLSQYCELLDKNPRVLSTNFLYVSRYLKVSMYEGWNFNSGNYLFTTDTK